MSDTLTVTPGTCSVTLSLPWAVAQQLVQAGPALIEQLSKQLDAQERKARSQSKYAHLEDRRFDDRKRQWRKLDIQADSRIRRLMRAEGIALNSAISRIAKAYGIPYSTLRARIDGHRYERRQRINTRRDTRIVRLYLQGNSHASIAKQVRPKVSAGTISKRLREHKDLIGYLRSSRPSWPKPGPDAGPDKQTADDTAQSDGNTAECDRDQAQAKRRAKHVRIGKSAARRLRNESPASPDWRKAVKVIAAEHQLDPFYLDWLVKERRREVRAYIRARRDAAIFRQYWAGWTQLETAKCLNVSSKTVSRVLKDASEHGDLERTRPINPARGRASA